MMQFTESGISIQAVFGGLGRIKLPYEAPSPLVFKEEVRNIKYNGYGTRAVKGLWKE